MSIFTWLSSRRKLAIVRTRKAELGVEMLEERRVLSAAQLYDIGSGVIDVSQTFQLHSNPGANQVVYLDFNGHTTGDVYGSGWDNLTSPAWDYSGNGASFTTAEQQIIQKVWARVAEDFAPFNIDITTQDPGVEALRKSGTGDTQWGVRVVITPNDTPAPGSGGVAYVGSFNFSTDTPVYVFNTSEKSVAEAASHEVGHSLGLSHDGTGTLAYYSGQGSGATSWGPIMGAAYSPNVTQWSKGEYSGANNKEDDLAIITSQNGFTYRSDDFGSSLATAAALLPQGASQISATYGIIERNTDSDWFSFYANAGTVAINVNPLTVGPNLAIRADLYNAAGTLLTTVNSATVLNASVNFALPTSGQFFIKITGAGRGDPLTNGFSSYGSLGNYRITGTVPAYTGTGPVNSPPVANPDSATTVAGTAVTVNVLANDSDPNGDTLTLTGVSNVVGGTAVVSGGAVIFTPTAGFTGNGTFNYSISDGKGGTANGSATVTVNAAPTSQSFTNNTNVTISSTQTSTVTSTMTLSGLSGTLNDVNVKLNLNHTYVSDLRITLIAPDGTRVVLFNRTGGSGDNFTNTTFDDSASIAIGNAAAPFNGTFRPNQVLSALNGKSANGVWQLEVRDYDRRDGGFLDNWTLTLGLTAPAAPAASPNGSAIVSWLIDFLRSANPSASLNSNALPAGVRNVLTELANCQPGVLAGVVASANVGPSARPLSDRLAALTRLFENGDFGTLEGDLPFGG